MNRFEVQDKAPSKLKGVKLAGARHSNSQRGIARVIKVNKRSEADARNAVTALSRRSMKAGR